MVGRLDGYLLLSLDIFLDDTVFLALGLVRLGNLGKGLVVSSSVQYVLEFEALELVELGAWQVTVVDEDVHYLLVVLYRFVIWLHHLCLQFFFGDVAVLWHDDCPQHVVLLCYGNLFYKVVILLELELYLSRLHILAI